MDQIEFLRERFRFDEWKDANRLDHELELHDIAVPEGVLPGLEAGRVRRIDPGDGTRLLRASWFMADDRDAMIVMDIRECPSRTAAHEVLLELLANIQSPHVERLTEDAPGDVAFSSGSSAGLIFARGNVVVRVANGGARLVPVTPIAREIDTWLVEGTGSATPLGPAAA
ncbi:hypothetical protein WBP06_22300 [Novosphingobium sp. BL-8H]|uniref:hypothetical protein n=1 Tax=Novosphingobium sp. BL-8H TaxID=3127640 RepID=UPI003757B43C